MWMEGMKNDRWDGRMHGGIDGWMDRWIEG